MGEIVSELIELLGYAIYALLSLVVGVIVMFINKKRVRSRMETLDYNAHKEKRKNNYTRNLLVDEQIAMKIKEDDDSFDDMAFKEWAKETFLEFQKAWTKKDIYSISSRLDNSLCEQYQLMTKTNVEKDCTNIVDIKKVNYIDFYAYSNDNEKEIIEVVINTVLLDYIINNLTQNIVSGSETIKERTTYKLKFYRKIGTQTNDVGNVITCPNCGGKIDKKQNKCEYCKTWVLNGMRDWILNNIEKY